MKIWVRNLTKDIDEVLILPVSEEKLDELLNPNDEYIILDSEILDVDEYESIDELNKLLLKCEENGIDKADLEVMSATFLYSEVKEMIMEDELPIIVDFDAETSYWNCGSGGNFISAFDKGMCVFEFGYYNPFSFEMTDDIHDWIDWESVWTNATTEGWIEVRVNGNGYLVHR